MTKLNGKTPIDDYCSTWNQMMAEEADRRLLFHVELHDQLEITKLAFP
jgi:hypothetical protein